MTLCCMLQSTTAQTDYFFRVLLTGCMNDLAQTKCPSILPKGRQWLLTTEEDKIGDLNNGHKIKYLGVILILTYLHSVL